jgi:hypothetical protein
MRSKWGALNRKWVSWGDGIPSCFGQEAGTLRKSASQVEVAAPLSTEVPRGDVGSPSNRKPGDVFSWQMIYLLVGSSPPYSPTSTLRHKEREPRDLQSPTIQPVKYSY